MAVFAICIICMAAAFAVSYAVGKFFATDEARKERRKLQEAKKTAMWAGIFATTDLREGNCK